MSHSRNNCAVPGGGWGTCVARTRARIPAEWKPAPTNANPCTKGYKAKWTEGGAKCGSASHAAASCGPKGRSYGFTYEQELEPH